MGMEKVRWPFAAVLEIEDMEELKRTPDRRAGLTQALCRVI
jgi:hypothetical protein